ncbi:hypothetical protein [Streptomyces galbus]|uniref:Secreted protein n=1 Tax=Streptomyces galbus TaxID=33898 RepID=A0ABX1IJ05_STRGB|nr:hypothetical protein [Streptomyces galbus]NKQ25165.1 hypothetical protein [Streptomyces galbus]
MDQLMAAEQERKNKVKLAGKTVVPVAFLALAAGAGAVYYTTSSGDPEDTAPQAQSASRPGPLAEVAHATIGDPGDPATWRLPIESYMPTMQQARLVSSTRDELIDQCMDDSGYPQWQPAPDLPSLGGTTLTDWRYGIHDAGLASTRGYHPDAGQQKAYDDAMEAGAVDESGAPDSAVRSCTAKIDGQVPPAQPADIVQRVSGEAFTESEKDPTVVAAFAKWSACMKAKGYDYDKPMDANEDPRFTDPGQVTATEIATAKADIACRDQYNVTRTWFDAESRIQRDKIAKHLDDFKAAAKAAGDAVAKAKAA